MKSLKIYPKTFFYTLGLLLFIVLVAHGLLYFLAPQVPLDLTASPDQGGSLITGTINLTPYLKQMIQKALPISLVCCVLISVLCSLLFSRQITVPVKQISAITERMAQMDKTAVCKIHTRDEIGVLAGNINGLYQNLLATIENLEMEKQRVRVMEQSKVDFMRAASHELKTPLTALNATLENMILGVGKYRDHDAYLPQCKEMVEQLTAMTHDILEASKLNRATQQEEPVQTDLPALIAKLCKPYQQIAAAQQISFSLELPASFQMKIPVKEFSKAVSNVLANAVAYTEAGKSVSVLVTEDDLVIENECVPIDSEEIPRLFEPFYRPDFSRSRDTGGNGLGLYIVDTIFKAIPISYDFTPMDGPGGMRFTIRLR